MKAKILLVEDNPQIMKLNRRGLAMRGYHIIEAETLTEGRRRFLAEQPDLIILDIMLPDGDGLKLCEELRQRQPDDLHQRHTPILFLSSKNKDDDVIAGFNVGGDDYLPKPYSLDVLIKRVEAILRRSGYIPETITKEI